jgi:hypothetical protein
MAVEEKILRNEVEISGYSREDFHRFRESCEKGGE